MSLPKILNSIIRTSKDDPKDVFQKMVKLQEECGELSDAILRANGLKSPRNKKLEELEDDILEELTDVIIITTSILPHYGFKIADLEDKLETKFKKWKENLDRYEMWKEEIKNEHDSKS